MSPGNEQRRPRYRMYVDESGDHTFKKIDDPNRRYLALVGLWFRESDAYVAFGDHLEAFKRSVFGPRLDSPVLLHREDIINRRGPFGILNDPVVAERFNTGLLDVISTASFHITCVVIDKKAHQERYVKPFHPYHFCLAALLDRYCGWLNYHGSCGDVMAEARGKNEDSALKEAYRGFYGGGTLMFRPEHHQSALTTKEIKLRTKQARIVGLQLADILAHPMKQSMLLERGVIQDPGDVFGKRMEQAANSKYNMRYDTGKVWGYGKVWLPVSSR